MPRFQYTAMDSKGKERKGRIEAESEQEAAAKLKQQGNFPTSITPMQAAGAKQGAGGKAKGGGGGFGAPRIKRKILTTFTRQLATLLGAGLPLVRALRTLERQAAKGNGPLQRVIGDLANSVEGGSTFSEALSGHPRTFNRLFVNMIRAGEASGALETVLERLALFMEKAQRIMGKVKAALYYPVVVLIVAGSITAGLMIFIVPKFATIFEEMLPGEGLPDLTQFVIDASWLLKEQTIPVIIGIVVFFFLVKLIRGTKWGAFAFDFMVVKVPPVSGLAVRTVVARFCRTLGTLMQSGVAVLQALQIVRDTAGNEVVARDIQRVHDAVKEGEGMSRPLSQSHVFPGMVVSMIEVGEETGALPEMLNRVADVYEEEVDRAVDALTSLIEPIMIVFLALIVGTIVIALFLPLIRLIERLGG